MSELCELFGYSSPIETDSDNREFNSGPLVVGRITFERRPVSVTDGGFSGEAFSGFPFYDQPCPVSKHRVEVDDLNRQYRTQTKTIVVDKRTHRIRYENETEHEVTVVIEPK